MNRYKITIEYDGGNFRGWQKQLSPTGIPTVQQAIESALHKITGQAITVEGSGRTDTGVHAKGQVAHFDLEDARPPNRLLDGLNFYLRNHGVVILDCLNVATEFHARFSAKQRTYEYLIVNRRSPLALFSLRAWHVVKELDVDLMQQGANLLLGTHDFNSFRASECQAKNSIRTIDYFQISKNDDLIVAIIKSKSFLHNQVRIMMGTIQLLGAHKITLQDIGEILKAKNRKAAGPTAPPHGLYLKHIQF